MRHLISVLFVVFSAYGCNRTDIAAKPTPAEDAVTFKMFVGQRGDRVKVTFEMKSVNTSVLDVLGTRRSSRTDLSHGKKGILRFSCLNVTAPCALCLVLF